MTAPPARETATARAATYALFAALFDRPLDAAGLAALRTKEMREAFDAAGVTLPADFGTADAETLRERLSVEYSHIFVAPVGKIVPHEGLMLAHEDDTSGATANRVARFMANVGYRLPPESGRVPDHLTVELAFTADLARREAEGDTAVAARARAIRRDFLGAHLGRWAGIAARRIAERDVGVFNGEMARFMADFVAEDTDALSAVCVRAAE